MFLVPVMIKSEQTQGSFDEGHQIELKFNETLPIGTFETAICQFVERSGQFEGSKDPQLYKNLAIVWFGSKVQLTIYLKGQRSIIVKFGSEELLK